ncbi:MAG TPA: hypothetical protein VJ161_10860 [Geobacteraceae bacterium]|nr:hypothetical protein [Geobacteraceae bacterium]
MKQLTSRKILVLLISVFLLLIPTMIHAQGDLVLSGSPPIEQPLIREGAFAVKLSSALGLGTTDNETESVNRLASVGIAPRNGWIADYPVTPDIVGELQQAVGDAADAKSISVDRYEALEKFADVTAESDLPVQSYAAGVNDEDVAEESALYSGSTTIEDYYYEAGPPVVTYYTPPPYYYSYYAWVPYPFWFYGSRFSGFYVLHDFHRPIHFKNKTVFVSNRFKDSRSHKVFHINPASRFHGKTFSGAGAPHNRDFISTGVPGNHGSQFNLQRTNRGTVHGSFGRSPGTGRSFTSPSATNRNFSLPRGRTGSNRMPSEIGRRDRSNFPAPGVHRHHGPSPGWTGSQRTRSDSGRTFNRPSGHNQTFNSPSHGNRNFIMPSRNAESFRAPSGVGNTNRSQFGTGRSFNSPSGNRSFSRPTGGGGIHNRGHRR